MTIKILVTASDLHGMYEASTDDGDPELGASPDEALGAAIRSLWLCGQLKGFVKIDLDIQSDAPPPPHSPIALTAEGYDSDGNRREYW